MKTNFSSNREINRNKLNSLELQKNKSNKFKNTDNNPYIQHNQDKNSKQFKFQNMSKLIVGKIDEILKEQPLKSGSLSSHSNKAFQNNEFDILASYPNLREDLIPKIKNNFSTNEESEISSFEFKKKLELNPDNLNGETDKNRTQKRNKSLKNPKRSKNKKETFMTNVEIEGGENNLEPKKTKSKYMEEQDKHVRELLDNIDDSDGILDEKEEKEYLRRNPERRDEVMQIKNLIKEVDDYKQSLKDEFDELQFLIKFVDETSDRINRHKQGVSKIFKRAGIKTKTDIDLPEEKEISEEKTYFTSDGVYDTKKNMNVVKSNLNRIYDSMLGFYAKLNTNIGDYSETHNDGNKDLNKFKRKSLKK
jgi:hypothetical protein